MSEVLTPRFHHVGVQTADLDNCLNWYRDFFQAKQNWSLDEFSDLTLSRLPGIRELTEVEAGGLRFHLFDRDNHSKEAPVELGYAYQHVCLVVESPDELKDLRERWIELYRSGRFSFARDDQPTEIVTDSDGVQSLYIYDVNGLEFEFTYTPPDGNR